MKQEISLLIRNVLDKLEIEDIRVSVTATDDLSHGDYASNVAFQVAKKIGKTPLETADILVASLTEQVVGKFEKIEVASPGFINFTLSKTTLLNYLTYESGALSVPALVGQRVMIEFTDPNPFKEFHIGHLYSNIVGESIARLLEAVGSEVRRVCYQGDVGLHVAKAIYGMDQKLQAESITLDTLEEKSLVERAKFLGQAYALGAAAYEDDPLARDEIVSLNRMVYEKDDAIREVYSRGRQWTLDYFETIYTRLGTKFWRYYFESEAGPIGLKLVREYLSKGVFTESQGAIVFPGENHGFHTRVFINSAGIPTYEAKELGLAPTKYADYPYDLSIVVTGNEINEYFKVLLTALSIIFPDLAKKTLHLSHGMVRLPEGKMSSRTGNIKTGEWLLNEAVARADTKIKEVSLDDSIRMTAEDKTSIAETVGVGAVKWALLRSGIGKDVEFSFDESVSFEGNSGPYLQYTYVRAQSILEKAGSETPEVKFDKITVNGEERSLLVLLTMYSDIVLEAAERYSPSTLTTYLFSLAQAFNLFYQKHPILKEKGNTRAFRLALTTSVSQVVASGLELLGIQTPERM